MNKMPMSFSVTTVNTILCFIAHTIGNCDCWKSQPSIMARPVACFPVIIRCYFIVINKSLSSRNITVINKMYTPNIM